MNGEEGSVQLDQFEEALLRLGVVHNSLVRGW